MSPEPNDITAPIPGRQSTGLQPPPAGERHHSSGTWVQMIAEAIRAFEGDPVALFAEIGWHYDDSSTADQRIPDEILRHIYDLVSERLGIEYFGLDLSKFMHAHTFHALGFAMLSSGTVGDALMRINRYSEIITSSARGELFEREDIVVLRVEIDCNAKGERLIPIDPIDAFFAGYIRMLQDMSGGRFAPLKVHLKRPKPDDIALFERYIPGELHFGCEYDEMIISPDMMALPVRFANENLAKQHDRITEAYLQQMDTGFDREIYRQILRLLPTGGLSQERLANQMHMSLRKLQYKLHDLGTSYQQLLDQARQELAQQLLADTQYSATEIAFLLGFSTNASFSRAFKRWTGQSPMQYREQI